MKTSRLHAVRKIGLAGLPMMQTRIPINPLKLVRVRIRSSLGGFGSPGTTVVLLSQAPLSKLMKRGDELEEEPPEKEELDWWSKYYASLEEIERKVRGSLARVGGPGRADRPGVTAVNFFAGC